MSYYKIRPRGGTASQWSTANPVLAEREIGFEYPAGGLGTGLARMKMGNGATAWNDLPYADISIAGLIGDSETSPASASHAVGDLIVYESQLYTVTAAIAQGDTLTPDGNISKTTIIQYLKANDDRFIVSLALARDNVTIPVDGYFEWQTANIPLAGYTPIGVLGTRIYDGTANGTLRTWCGFNHARVIGNQLDFLIRNSNKSNAAKIKYELYVLYEKN